MDENRDFLIIDEYINSICKKIMSPRKKNEVYDELYSHLIEEYEKNFSLGMDDESAQLKAIEKMGDKDKIASDFGKLYSIIPTEYMRSSLNFIIWGMALSFFQFNLFPGMGEITKFIGGLLLLYGLFKLRGVNKKLNIALFIDIGTELLSLIIQNISLYMVDSSTLQFINAFILTPITLFEYWCIFSGIKDITKNLVSEEDKQPHLTSGFLSYVICTIIIVFSALTEVTVLIYVTPILMIFTLCHLGRAKKILAYKEPEFDLTETLKKGEKVIFVGLAIILAVTPLISTYIASSPRVEATIYSTTDSSIAKSEIEKARINILKLGFPEEYLKDLPDSEVLEYSDATHLLIEKPDEIKQTTLANDKVVICTSEVFIFYFPDREIRTIMRISLPDNSKAKYRNGVYHQYYDGDFVPMDKDENREFFIALSDDNNETFSTAPLSEYTPKSQRDKFFISGYEFAFSKGSTNRRAYLAHSAQIKNNISRWVATDAVFLWQKYPIGISGLSINDMALKEFDGVMTFGGSDFEPIKRFDLYDAFDYKPEYTVKNNATVDDSNKN